MALNANAIKVAQLIDPQVIAPFIDKKFYNRLKFAPLMTIDETLVGRPGSKVDVPFYTYIGMAEDVEEGEDIPIGQLTQDYDTFTIKKAGKGVQITDEAVLIGLGDPVGEAIDQLARSLAHKVNADCQTALNSITAPRVFEGTALDADNIADALVLFGEDEYDDNGNPVPKVLFVNPTDYANLRKTSEWLNVTEMGVQALHSGIVGAIYGCQVQVSADITATDKFIVRPGALRLYSKRGTLVESDRDIINKSTVLTADKHYGVHLYDASKAIKITLPSAP